MGALGKICPKILEMCYLIEFEPFNSNGLKRHQQGHKNQKRPIKFLKVILKAREHQCEKLMIFFPLLGPFGVPCYVISKFWSFKVIKAKKAAPVAREAKSHSSASKYIKLLLIHLYAIIILQKRPIKLYKLYRSLLKTKMYLEGRNL